VSEFAAALKNPSMGHGRVRRAPNPGGDCAYPFEALQQQRQHLLLERVAKCHPMHSDSQKNEQTCSSGGQESEWRARPGTGTSHVLLALMETLKVAILTCSDRCFSGESIDASGPAVREYLEANLATLKCKQLEFVAKVVPDERPTISETLIHWADVDHIPLIITSGGTGFAPRDVTPEATMDVLHKAAPGLVVAMISASLAVTPHAMLSRPAAGIRNSSLIVNLPGSTKAVKENLAAIISALPHAISLIQDIPKASTVASHQALSNSMSDSSSTEKASIGH